MHSGRTLTLLGALGLLIGALLPWASMTSLTLGVNLRASGFEGNGFFTCAIGVVLLLVAIIHRGKPGKIYSWPTSILSAIAGIVIAVTAFNIITFQTEYSEITTAPGSGLCLSPIGALFAIIGGLLIVPMDQEKNMPPST